MCVVLGHVFFFQAEDGIRDFCLSRGLGDVTVKKFLNSVMQEELRPIRERREMWAGRLPEVYELLRVGSEKARAKAAQTLAEVRHAMRIDYFEDGNLLK